MTTHPAHRAGRPQRAVVPAHHLPAAAPVHHAPNAALLIDFDNVTLGVRSDLAKELRTLLNSDIIRGKVAVQRAYADWRRYPQYIVSLSEASIDLIFAPAFGTNKKNATDIRLAVDATELVFTRPEIGTFILLSGDSDFSSLVLKLKEYGKYVIGVGIRESASDILIQNCDEYYSYSDLAGLSKESDVPGPPRDPWELVAAAVAQMVRNHDVMRADRLKQVMQQLDPEFDEAKIGFNRFSKFVTEAGTRGLLQVIKQENGQLDVAPAKGAPAAAAPAAPAARREGAAAAEGGEGSPASRRRRGGRGRGRPRSGEEATTPATEPAAPPPPRAPRPTVAHTTLTLAEAFHLLARALGELPAPVPHDTLRARMAALHGKEDPLLEPARFAKLLRQANDAEVADVRLVGEDQFEISQHKANLALQMQRPPVTNESTSGSEAPAAVPATRQPPALRFRGGSRTSTRQMDVPMVGVVDLHAAAVATTLGIPAPGPVLAAPASGEVSEPATAKAPRGGKRATKAASKPAVESPAVKPAATRGVAKRAGKAPSALASTPVAAKAAPASKAKKSSKRPASKTRAG